MVRTYETFNDIHNFYISLNVHGFCVINFQNMNTIEIGKRSVWVLFLSDNDCVFSLRYKTWVAGIWVTFLAVFEWPPSWMTQIHHSRSALAAWRPTEPCPRATTGVRRHLTWGTRWVLQCLLLATLLQLFNKENGFYIVFL